MHQIHHQQVRVPLAGRNHEAHLHRTHGRSME